MKKQQLLILAATCALSAGVVGAIALAEAVNPQSAWELRATDKAVSLTAANAPASITSTSVKASCEEESIESGNSYITWDYYNVKKSASGHIVLSTGNEGMEESCTGYVLNHMPITGLKSVEVTFGGNGAVNVYGSNLLNGEYVFLDVLNGDADETDSTDRIVDYQFIKLANASLSTDLDIKSIEYHYSCDQVNSVEKNDRMIPALGYSKNSSFAGETSTSVHMNEFSSESFIFNATNGESRIFVKIGFDIPKAELSQYKIVYYANASEIAASKGFSKDHNYTRLAFKDCYESGGSWSEGYSSGAASANIVGGSGWTKYEYTFETLFNGDITTNMTQSSGYVNALRVGLPYAPVSGSLYIDQLHIERVGGSYLKGADLYEQYDLTNENVGGWGAKNGAVTTAFHSPETSNRCFAATLTNEYSSVKFPSLGVNMAGRSISFDVKATLAKWGGEAVAAYDQFIKFSFSYGGTIGNSGENNFYTTADIHLNAKTSTYYTVTNLGDNWYRISIDFDAAASAITPAAGSYNVGVETRGRFADFAIDNMYLS